MYSRLIEHDDEWMIFKEGLDKLFKKYKNINIDLMGFPKDWKTFL